MDATAVTTADSPLQIVPMTPETAEVRLRIGRAALPIGRVGSSNGRWFWQHRDGERSSPIAANRSDAANALASYHEEFKHRPAAAVPERRLLFG
jgi:hypothetical protein